MSPKESVEESARQYSLMKILNSIKGWQKTVLTTIFCAIILSASAFVYNNISLPKDDKRIVQIQADIREVKETGTMQTIESIRLKGDVMVTKDNIKRVEDEIKEIRSDIKILIGLVRKVNENTK